jgi:Putative transposase/Transposase zinc-binding domain
MGGSDGARCRCPRSPSWRPGQPATPQGRSLSRARSWHGPREGQPMAALAPAYTPRRPAETILYALVREHLESFLTHAREHYDGGLPRYVERELRAFLKCGQFSEGFTRAHCEACGHDLLVAFSCHGRSICPSCCGRRMANGAAHLVDRVLPDVPVRQYVLSLPYELRRLAAFKADVLTALARIFVEATFANYRSRATRDGIDGAECGSVLCVQRFGSLNLNVHFHVLVLDGVFSRNPLGRVLFHPAPAPTVADLGGIVERTRRRADALLRRRGYLDERPPEDRSNELRAQSALDACAAVAMGRGQVATLQRPGAADAADEDHAQPPDKTAAVVEQQGFNLHAGVRIQAGDDLGRERLARYALRPPLSLERLRKLPDGRIGYRLKYVSRGRGKHRVMTGLEFMARLAAIIAPPRYPLVRYAGVLGPRSSWRRDVVPKPRDKRDVCTGAREKKSDPAHHAAQPNPKASGTAPKRPDLPPKRGAAEEALTVAATTIGVTSLPGPQARPGDVIRLAPNVLSVQHWDRLLGGLLYATSPRVDWASLLRRSFSVDVLECPKCRGKLRILAVITEPEPVRRILAHLGMPVDLPPLARTRDPTDELDDNEATAQLSLDLA